MRPADAQRQRRIELAAALHERFLREERKRQSGPGGLIHFIRYFWHVLEPGRPFLEGWALWAICQHLEAVSDGRLRRVLINCPPGSMKSLACNVFWPAWDWGPNERSDRRYLSFSYSSHLTYRDNDKMLQLLQSPEYQELWGDRFGLREKGKVKISNTDLGFKFAAGVDGTVTGERGDVVVLDDPHAVTDGESEPVRTSTTLWFREAMSNRLNDMDKSAIVVICQRVHEDDVSGVILTNELPYEHLCIPMEYEGTDIDPDTGDKIETSIGWSDPRTDEGECFFPERFTPEAVAEAKLMGTHVWNGQYQQRPEARGGGIIKRAYWQTWEKAKFPVFDYLVASLDPAFTTKQENDPAGFSLWGVFRDPNGNRSAMLVHAWRKWLDLHGVVEPRLRGETEDDYRARTSDTWGLVEWTADTCKKYGVDRLLIEAKASGLSVAQEMNRLYSHEKWTVDLVDPKGLDKMARVIRVQPLFSGGLVWAPDRPWATLAIDEAAIFPRGRFDDVTDSMTQALWWLRSNDYMQRSSERLAAEMAESAANEPLEALYPV